jgi:preprotein translocase subunit YajC
MIGAAWAQAGAPAGAPPAMVSILPWVLMFAVIYFLLIRPQQQKAKEHRTMLDNLKKNDDVITSGGLYGKVVALADDVVTLEIAPNVRVRVSRPQIGTVLSAARPEEDKSKEKEKGKEK